MPEGTVNFDSYLTSGPDDGPQCRVCDSYLEGDPKTGEVWCPGCDMAKCLRCSGTGCVDTPYSGSDPSCPECDGEGWVWRGGGK